jgi:predicted phage terminase large subunit-like protein
VKVELTADIIEGFVSSILHQGFDNPTPVPPCHREWWDLCTQKHRFIALAAPRGFAKSTAITHSYTLAALLFRQRDYALIVSDTETQSIQFLADIKKELEDNEQLRLLFSVGEVTKSTETDIICTFLDGKAFRIQAKGAEQKLRGLKWNGKRPNLIVIDDLENDELVMNRDRREKLKRWFHGALIPCLSDRGIIRYVGTILHQDALLESFMPRPSSKHTVVEGLKTWSTQEAGWKALKYKAHNEDHSLLLWPQKWSKAKLQQQYNLYIESGAGDLYNQEYLNEPIDEATAMFKKADFIETHPDRAELTQVNHYISVDLAISTKNRADYTVFAIGALDSNKILQLREIIRARMDSREIIETFLALQRTYSPELFLVEDGQIAKTLLPVLRETMQQEDTYCNLQMVKSSTDKVSRASPLQARMRAKGMTFNKSADWWPTFEEEFTKFPRGTHDDQVDAVAQLAFAINKMSAGPTDKEIEEEEYEEEFGTYSREQGKSAITGY